jgi:thiamine pyrophosphate-dependent acetolactate synthase large subunit-like protein
VPLVTAERVVEVTTDADELGRRAPADVAVLDDHGAVIVDLAARVAARVPGGERERRRARPRARRGWSHGRPRRRRRRPTKVGIPRALARVAPDALVAAGGVSFSLALHGGFAPGPTALLGTEGGGLGYGPPAVVGVGVGVAEGDAETEGD